MEYTVAHENERPTTIAMHIGMIYCNDITTIAYP
jgi:hypothetical protein